MFLQPRFGITSSNCVESSNSMFMPTREGLWLNTIEKSLYIMAEHISDLGRSYNGVHACVIVPRVVEILQTSWRNAAGYLCIMTNSRCHVQFEGVEGVG